jgi:hypothetical protein
MEIANSKIVAGKGLILKKRVKKGEIVFMLSGEISDSPTRESIHIGDNKHIYDKMGIFINHSFEPTVYISNVNVIALDDMNDGDEITFDYNVSEINMANQFKVGDVLVCGETC